VLFRSVAYVTGAGEAAPPTAAELRAHLQARLPEQMVPSAYVAMAALPLTVNGKVDRGALPAPDAEALARAQYEPPEGDLEQALAAIWEELLKVRPIGRHDNFFELGGDSLLAMQLSSRAQLELSADIPTRAVLATPTVFELAASVQECRAAAASGLAPAALEAEALEEGWV